MKNYERKDAKVSAVMWTAENEEEMKAFCDKVRFYDGVRGKVLALDFDNRTERGYKGDYLIRKFDGSFSIIDGRQFENVYSEIVE